MNTYALVAGIDEVGRGPLAGPVVAAAVILREPILGLRDSKVLSARERERLALLIMRSAIVGLGAATVVEIDRVNILQATFIAMRRALARLGVRPEMALVDGNQDPRLGMPTRCIVGGDGTVQAIAAASIVAKVTRDRLMRLLATRYPGFGWERNAGYGTREHLAALRLLGATPHHRRSFRPVADVQPAVWTRSSILPEAHGSGESTTSSR